MYEQCWCEFWKAAQKDYQDNSTKSDKISKSEGQQRNTQSKVVFLENLRNAEAVVARYQKDGVRKSKLSTSTKHHASQIRSKTPEKKVKKVFGRRANSGALCRIFRLNKISGKINPIVTIFSTNACGRLLSHLNTLFGGKYWFGLLATLLFGPIRHPHGSLSHQSCKHFTLHFWGLPVIYLDFPKRDSSIQTIPFLLSIFC